MCLTPNIKTSSVHKINMCIIQSLVPLTTTECDLQGVVTPYHYITQYLSRHPSSHGETDEVDT